MYVNQVKWELGLKKSWDQALIRRLAFWWFCKDGWVYMMGQGGGQTGSMWEAGEYCLCQWWCMFGQGGGQELPIDKIGVGVGKIGQGGGGCRFVVVSAGVRVL
jgi:hypothetical protein